MFILVVINEINLNELVVPLTLAQGARITGAHARVSNSSRKVESAVQGQVHFPITSSARPAAQLSCSFDVFAQACQ